MTLKTKGQISTYILRGSVAVLLVSCAIVALSSAISLPNKRPKLQAPQNNAALGVNGNESAASAAASAIRRDRTLTFADRVAYQRAIEEVYWQHRIWPKANAGPKPPLDKVMSQAQIEKKAEDYLRKSQLVADQRGSPITASELQGEMDRMASYSKQPEVLRELFATLGNDAFVIAECLARPILAERLVAQNDAASESSQARSKGPVVQRSLSSSTGLLDSAGNDIVSDGAVYKLPEISASAGCTDDTWTVTRIVNAPDARDGHTTVWTGTEMITWGGFHRQQWVAFFQHGQEI